MKNHFLVREVAELTGLRPREVVDACDRGIIQPKEPAEGPGTRRVFSFKNLMQFGVFRLLKRFGFIRPEIKQILDEIEKSGLHEKMYSPQIEEGTLVLLMESQREGVTLKLVEIPPGGYLKFGPKQIRSSFNINMTEIKRGLVEHLRSST
jgi:DNA-binding transcriptional MerR regulator